MIQMLYIFGGLPGTGKSTLASALASQSGAVYLRIDTIEQTLKNVGVPVSGPEGYLVAYSIAEENLRLGRNVVADSVNPLERTRAAWRNVADRAGARFVELEVICTDDVEHRRRVETRSADIELLSLPTWKEVNDRIYEPWESEHIILDTAGRTVDESLVAMMQKLS